MPREAGEIAVTLPMLVAYRLSPPLLAAERLARLLGRLVRSARNEPGPPPDPAGLPPRWLRDIGLPEDYGRRYEDRMDDWFRLGR